ncbi:MAG: hypothetical protein PWQ16_994 [bacterium]|nr:MAG: hypothetical protein XD52_1383 [bacterium 42_11]MDK2871642.1 hypothetical protein [bacterium]
MGFLGRIILFLILNGVIVLLFQVVSLKAGYEVDALQKRVEALAKKRQELLLTIGELTSFKKVKEYIENNNFRFIDGNKVVYLEIVDKPLVKAESFDFRR